MLLCKSNSTNLHLKFHIGRDHVLGRRYQLALVGGIVRRLYVLDLQGVRPRRVVRVQLELLAGLQEEILPVADGKVPLLAVAKSHPQQGVFVGICDGACELHFAAFTYKPQMLIHENIEKSFSYLCPK